MVESYKEISHACSLTGCYQTKCRLFLPSQQLRLIQCLHEWRLIAKEGGVERSVTRAQFFHYLVYAYWGYHPTIDIKDTRFHLRFGVLRLTRT